MGNELFETYVSSYVASLEEAALAASRAPRSLSPQPAMDITGFFNLVGLTLKRQQEIDGAKKPIFYTEEYPEQDDNLDGEVVAYGLVARKPGTFEQQKTGLAMNQTNIRQRTPIFRGSFDDPDVPGCKIYTLGQWFDNEIRFRIYARTNKIANARALWFEDFIDNWTWLFKANGLQEILYLGRADDRITAPENKKISERTLSYYIRTEKIKNIREHVLRSLNVAGSLE